MKVLEPVCAVSAEEAALDGFAEFADAWGQEVPGDRPALGERLEEFTSFLRFDTGIRRIAARRTRESVNAQARGYFLNGKPH